ncbi:MAG: MerR family transcriptional regulator [Thermomicrobiales bacterium]
MPPLVSTGEVAKQLGVSVSFLRKLELVGASPPAQRIAGLDRRVYRPEDVEALRQVIAERRAGMSHAELDAA